MKKISPLRYSLKIQLVVLACLTLLASTQGKVSAYSLLIGASIFVVPNLYFTYYAFRFSDAKFMEWVRHSFMWGEMGKLSLTAVGFALVFNFVSPLHIASLFIGFVGMIILQWWLARKIASSAGALEDSNETRGQ